MRFKRILGVAAVCVGVCGCHVAADVAQNMAFETCLFTDEVRGKIYYPVLARDAWKEYLSCHPQCDGKDFAKGFKLGYADYLEYGGCGGTRPLPPMRYWKVRNETPEGRAATELWLDGFREGAAAAKASGKRELIVVPVGERVAPPPADGPPLGDPPAAPPAQSGAPALELPKPRSLPAPSFNPVSGLPSAPPPSPLSPPLEQPKPRSLPASPYNPMADLPDLPPPPAAMEQPKPRASAAPAPYSSTSWRDNLSTQAQGRQVASAPANPANAPPPPSANPGQPAKPVDVRKEQVQLQKITENVQRIEDMKRRNTPRDPEQHYRVGMIAMQAGATQEGLRWLNSALREDPTHAPTHKALMEYYQSVGDVRRAAEHRALAAKYAKHDDETNP